MMEQGVSTDQVVASCALRSLLFTVMAFIALKGNIPE
jgi:hypothetical protein